MSKLATVVTLAGLITVTPEGGSGKAGHAGGG
jgi:hypothetical protein